jgi:hypothetical protein
MNPRIILLVMVLAASLLSILFMTAHNQNGITDAPYLRIPSPTSPTSCVGAGNELLLPESSCCPGLIDSTFEIPDVYGGCIPKPILSGEIFCINCGDGICGALENPCTCPADCIPNPEEIRSVFLSSIDFGIFGDSNQSEFDMEFMLSKTNFSDFETRIKSAFSANFPSKHSTWRSSGEGLLDWLYENEPALMRDLIASLANPAGMRPYLSVGGPDADIIRVDEAYALGLFESALGSESKNPSIEDSGSFWTVCDSGFCCEIPKLYGPGSEMSCS